MRFIPCSLKLEATMKANRIHAESIETDTVFNPTKRKNINPPKFSFAIWILILFLHSIKIFPSSLGREQEKKGGCCRLKGRAGSWGLMVMVISGTPLPPTHTPINIVSPSSPSFPIRCWSLVSDSHPSPWMRIRQSLTRNQNLKAWLWLFNNLYRRPALNN